MKADGGLQVLRRAWESAAGCSEVCRDGGGVRWVRLRVFDKAVQKALLSTLDRRSAACVRVERETVELWLPFREGMSLRRWVYQKEPGLGARRDACLSLAGRLMEDRVPPAVLANAAREENLQFSEGEVWLSYLPSWDGRWTGLSERDAVNAAASLCCAVLRQGISGLEERRFPPELRMILLRTKQGGYTGWEQLVRDLSALPDEWVDLEQVLRRLAARADRRTKRWRRQAAAVLAAALILAALASLAAAFRTWRHEREGRFQGMVSIGTQELR